MDTPKVSSLANILITFFQKDSIPNNEKKITVNPVISKVASWYEKLRNAMDYREEEVILRAAIERILKRRLLFGGSGKTIAEPLLHELAWARYFPDETISESMIGKVEKNINLYLELRNKILLKHKISESILNEWVYHLMSSSIEHKLILNKEKEIMTNFMFQVIKNNVKILDDNDQTRDAQVFIAVHKSFAKDDLALLRFHLFKQYFGELKEDNLFKVADSFIQGYEEIQRQLNYPRKEKILNFIKNKTAVFFMLEDILHSQKENIRELVQNEKEFEKIVFTACQMRYGGIAAKVNRAIVRSVIFILLTKALFAFTVEGTFESIVYGKILWASILLNTAIPPMLMVIIGAFIRPPGRENSRIILVYIKTILFEENPKIGAILEVKKAPDKIKPMLNIIFTLLWFATFVLTFGAIVFLLSRLRFNIASQSVFIFFLAMVSFFAYRINQSANIYKIEEKQSVGMIMIDFFFMPFVQVGRHLAEGISQINIFLFILDFVIETPFKGMFAFFEQWFLFLQAKREKLE